MAVFCLSLVDYNDFRRIRQLPQVQAHRAYANGLSESEVPHYGLFLLITPSSLCTPRSDTYDCLIKEWTKK